jgi:hypothetical protein
MSQHAGLANSWHEQEQQLFYCCADLVEEARCKGS